MASIVLLEGQLSSTTNAFIAIVLAWIINCLFILVSNSMSEKLGPRVLIAMERLMGMLLVMMSVQMLLDGFSMYIKDIHLISPL